MIEVTKNQYDVVTKHATGIVAHRKDEQGRYWIKIWISKHTKYVQQLLTQSA